MRPSTDSGSGLAAAVHASRTLHMGDAEVLLAGGVEHMTRGPWVLSKASKPLDVTWNCMTPALGGGSSTLAWTPCMAPMAWARPQRTFVDLHNISREDQDAFACRSQQKAAAAQREGRLAEEIVGVDIPRRKQDPLHFDRDEFIKPQTSMEVLAKLRPAFRKEGGSVTAGNASGLNDGAAALLLANEEGLKTHGLEPLVRIVSSAVVGVAPRIMGIGPVEASNRALAKAGIGFKDLDIIELNEAFAAQSLALHSELGLADDDARINPNGGAIALGHPLGMTGARILLAAARQLHRTGGRYGLVTLCIGVGQGYAAVVENTTR